MILTGWGIGGVYSSVMKDTFPTAVHRIFILNVGSGIYLRRDVDILYDIGGGYKS